METNTKKKKTLTTALAVALAALLLMGGGTFAYLQSTSDDVANKFDTNKVMVTLTEESGQDYDIIPGTSETKDPIVTVDNTVDAYVFLEVTDNTEGLVGYEIDKTIWTALEGIENVYYTVVSADAGTKVLGVLVDNKVTYSTNLENSDMLDSKGNLKTGIDLTFKASAIQQEGFDTPLAGYKGIPVTVDSNTSSLRSTIINLLEDDRTVMLETSLTSSNTSARNILTVESGNGTLDLNGKSITGWSSKYASNLWAIGVSGSDTELTITGEGTVYGGANCTSNTAVYAENNAKVTILSGNYTTGLGMNSSPNSVVLANSGATIEIYGGKFYTSYGSSYSGQNWVLNLQDNTNSKIICYGGTFVNFDPSKTGTEPAGQSDNFVAEGYHVEQEKQTNGDIWYTVVKD